MTEFRCLSIRQPWAWAVCIGAKDVENRSWDTDYRGPIAIHAGSSKQDFNYVLKRNGSARLKSNWFPMGAVIGVAEVADVVILNETLDQNPWTIGPCCWLLKNARLIAKPITVKGKLNLFSLSDSISEKLQAQLSEPEPVRDQATVATYLKTIQPNEHDNCTSRASNYAALGDFASAIRNCTTALQHEPSNSDAYRIRAASLYYSGNQESALADCNRAIEIATENANAYFVRAMVQNKLGNLVKSEEDYRRAKELDPSLPALG